ncbi:MAG TPA: single-stranded-DNA-specific exonuclease RecJ [Flavobacteriales bacterium]|nr:single-stranded-DNA-specific exonuclease RecJ [Flavobacteriales bacterium]HNE80675.1 single-stranded-DNA-specific exonuclease RecJ [Flavobacteriales bacterium]HNI05317.1 single-stranded-DNA-specific exonuclease RecJ [Flavobacteriales bacterium]HNK40560.1 single-stranded-DNA-specific exonuclease RecJ [Flavobacteriales bacterium]HNM71096.1 single-stranded-DNA-specific exonuclease RecJ [Flavobacteriales bacterium]
MSTALERYWRLKPAQPDAVVRALTSDRCSPELAHLLAQRGITTPEEAGIFFRPRLEHLHDPFLMKDMDRAVERIELALGDKERIMVYGDYDVDGTTSVALMYGFLNRFTSNLRHYVPDRYAEGYGISTLGIDRAAADGVSLIIALDCGIKSIDKAAYAREKGIDLIICDHHLPGEKIPEAVAVLDPKRSDCTYPYKELSGCGIGFKLVQALAQHNNMPFVELEELLDLVAISIACDIVPLDGENRTLAYHGLRRLNNGPVRPGLDVMLRVTNNRRPITVSDLVFTIGPRINAAGRIEHGQQAVELLLSSDPGLAEQIGLRIDENNSKRQGLDKEITRQALDLFNTEDALRDAWSTVVFNKDWHKGVVGIVASRLIETHYRPTVVLTESNGKASGSARSVRGFDVHEAISACADLLDQYGGHMYAAGLSMPVENVDAFRERFEHVVRERMPPELRVPVEEIDLELSLDRITDRFVRDIGHMAPFGPRNMRPVFMSCGITTKEARIVGEDHLKLILQVPGKDGGLDAIAFRQGKHLDLVRNGTFSLLYTLEENEWNGRRSLQLNVKDIKPGVGDPHGHGAARSEGPAFAAI